MGSCSLVLSKACRRIIGTWLSEDGPLLMLESGLFSCLVLYYEVFVIPELVLFGLFEVSLVIDDFRKFNLDRLYYKGRIVDYLSAIKVLNLLLSVVLVESLMRIMPLFFDALQTQILHGTAAEELRR